MNLDNDTPSLGSYTPVNTGTSLPSPEQQRTDTPDSLPPKKRKQYVPFTLHTLTLLGYAVLCLALIGGLEVLARMKSLQTAGAGLGFLPQKRGLGEVGYEPYAEVGGRIRGRFEKGNVSFVGVTTTSGEGLRSSSEVLSAGSTEGKEASESILQTSTTDVSTALASGTDSANPPPSSAAHASTPAVPDTSRPSISSPPETSQPSIPSSPANTLSTLPTQSLSSSLHGLTLHTTHHNFLIRPSQYASNIDDQPTTTTTTPSSTPPPPPSTTGLIPLSLLTPTATTHGSIAFRPIDSAYASSIDDSPSSSIPPAPVITPTDGFPIHPVSNQPGSWSRPGPGRLPQFRPVSQYAPSVGDAPPPTQSTAGAPTGGVTVAGGNPPPVTSSAGGQPEVTLVAVDSSFTKTYTGPVLTVSTTDARGVATTLRLVQSPVTASTQATAVPVVGGFGNKDGGVRTVRTTDGSGVVKTVLVDGNKPVVTLVPVGVGVHTVHTMRDGKSTTVVMVASTITPRPEVTMVPVAGTYQGGRTVVTTRDGRAATVVVVASTVTPGPVVTMVPVGGVKTVLTTDRNGKATTEFMLQSTVFPTAEVTMVPVDAKFAATYGGEIRTVVTTDGNGKATTEFMLQSTVFPTAEVTMVPVDAKFAATYSGEIKTVVTTDQYGKATTEFMVESTMFPTAEVTLVPVNSKYAATYSGEIKTVVTTDQYGKATTEFMVESTIFPTAEVTLVPVNSKFAATYSGEIITVLTTDKHGKATTQLLIESTITPTTTSRSPFEATYVADGRLATILTTGPNGSPTTVLAFEIPATPSSTPTPSTHAPAASSHSKFDYRVVYFGAHYLPTLLAVLLSILWKPIDTDIKRLEPFYLLSSPQGAPSSALTENLLFSNTLLIPFHALRQRQWIVFLSAIIYCPLLTLVQFLASSAVSLSTTEHCDPFRPTRTCGDPFVVVSIGMVRGLQGVLGAVVVGVIGIVLLQRRREVGLFDEPWSLVGLAGLMVDWGRVRAGFEGVGDTEAEVEAKVKGSGRRWRIYEGVFEGQRQVGVEIVEDTQEAGAEAWSDIPVQDSGEIYRSPRRSPRPPMLKTATLVLFVAFLCAVLGIILTYSLTYASPIEHFLSGQSISVTILFIAFGITVRFGWEPIDRG